jgi:hypothetical protein
MNRNFVVDCVFPFTYSGEVFNTCTRKNSENGRPWCATAVDKNTGEVMLGNWGDCDKTCMASGRWPEEQAITSTSLDHVATLLHNHAITPSDIHNSASR